MKLLSRVLLLLLLLLALSAQASLDASSLPLNHPKHPRNQQLRELEGGADTQALRKHLLTNYDKGSYPFSHLWAIQHPSASTSRVQYWMERDGPVRKGLPIEVGLNFHRVFKVDVVTSVADLIVWVRQRWVDPRLAWDPAEWNGITTVHFWIGDGGGSAGEVSEIWTPDILLWNQEEPLAETLSDSHATVNHDGTVFWSRPGHLKPVCKFEGLENFPFESLTCVLELGSWVYSGLYLRPIKMDEGYSIGGSETAGESFAEFALEEVACEEFIYPPYPTDPESDWPVLLYRVSFQRAWKPYARGYLLLQIVLNVCAFCSFWLPPHIGERMGLNITAMLAAVASELVVSEKVPPTTEMTWFAQFSLISLCFATMALIESAAVIFFHYHTGDDLVPAWIRLIQKKCFQKQDHTKLVKKKKNKEFYSKPIARTSDASSEPQKEGPKPKAVPRRVSRVSFATDPMEDSNHTREAGEDSSDELSSEEIYSEEATQENTNVNSSTAIDASLAASFRGRKSVKTIMGRDADDFKNAKEMENNVRWQIVAHGLDDFSRVFFPVAFSIILGFVLSEAENI